MPLLLAQLVAPPVQNSPVRLPQPSGLESRPVHRDGPPPPAVEVQPFQTPGVKPGPTTPDGGKPAVDGAMSPLPSIKGLDRYGPKELRRALASCLVIENTQERLNACAAALTARLVADGYVNSRVYVQTSPAPGYLEVVEGRLVELRVTGPNPSLNRRVQHLLSPLQGQVLNVPQVERELQLLKRLPSISSVRGNLSRLGSDPSQAVFRVNVEPAHPRWQGDVSLRNDGSNGSGEFRGVATLLKSDLATSGDTLLLFGELDSDDTPSLGALITSISYTAPLSDAWNFTGAFGYSRRNLVELPSPSNGISSNQYQGLGQLEWVFKDNLSQRWSVFAGFSGNRSNTYLDGKSLPDTVPQSVREPRSGYVRLGVGGSGLSGSVGWGGSLYFLQGIAAVTPDAQRDELAQVGIDPGNANAIGALISAGWGFAPNWQLNTRLGGQVAFNPLTSPMQFTLGSDVGIRGLPGQLISGDSGWLATGEVVWTFWQNKTNALQLVPFIGAGGITTTLNDASFSDTVGSGGLLARWLGGDNWAVELGWAEQFNTNDNPGSWEDWLLGSGLYAQIKYRF